jgi:hypothetical protein
MKDSLSAQLQHNTRELVTILSGFSTDELNRRPSHGGWTPAEIAEHLVMLDKRILRILDGNTTPAGRDSLEKVPVFAERLANRSTKIDAPPFLIPAGNPKDTATVTSELLAERQKLTETITQKDLLLLYPDAPHRFFGTLTGAEWIRFLILHSERHISQLQELAG